MATKTFEEFEREQKMRGGGGNNSFLKLAGGLVIGVIVAAIIIFALDKHRRDNDWGKPNPSSSAYDFKMTDGGFYKKTK